MSAIGACRMAVRFCVRGASAPTSPSAGFQDDLHKRLRSRGRLARRYAQKIGRPKFGHQLFKIGASALRDGGKNRRAELQSASARKDHLLQTREVGTVAALEGYRKVDANNPTK